MAAPPRILVVDDDGALCDALRRCLRLEGFAVDVAGDGGGALRSVADQPPSAVVLDVGLPDLSGRAVCARLRAGGIATPILILSARDEVDDRIAGLEAGADDYLVKPFEMGELVARLRALLRRAGGGAARGPTDPAVIEPPLRIGRLLMDPTARQATWDGRDLGLTRRELDLLEALARNRGVVLTRARLLELVWGYEFAADTNVVDVFISYLRRKLEAVGAPSLIATVRGVGFVLQEP